MLKQRLIATVLITIAWAVLDFIIHGNLLMDMYTATASLWKPMTEMSPAFMNVISLASAFTFVFLYCCCIRKKSLQKGIKAGALVGLLIGIMCGIGSYGYMPIPLSLGISWAAAHIVKFAVAGAITGKLVEEKCSDDA